jgi:hypothetical protein
LGVALAVCAVAATVLVSAATTAIGHGGETAFERFGTLLRVDLSR